MLSEEDVKGEMDEWLARGLVARSLGWRVQAKAVACEFQLCTKLKGDIVVYNL